MTTTLLGEVDRARRVESIGIAYAAADMRLAEPVFAPWTGNALLQAGTVLTERHLQLLRRAQVRVIRVCSDTPEPPGATRRPPDGSADDAPDVPGRLLERFIRACGPSVAPERWAVACPVGLRAAALVDAAIARMTACEEARQLLVGRCLNPAFLTPALDGCVLSTIAGTALGWDEDRLVELAMAAFLADVGMVLVPETIVHKPGLLDLREKAELERHVAEGADLLAPLAGTLSPTILRVAREHHERVDGTGYPDGRAGTAIMPEAQLVSLAHLYLAGIRGRSYRPALPPREAMDLVAGVGGTAVRTDLVEAFVGSIAVHPVGSVVRLRSGHCARVVAAGGRNARLVVEWDQDGRRIRPFEARAGVDLVQQVVACSA